MLTSPQNGVDIYRKYLAMVCSQAGKYLGYLNWSIILSNRPRPHGKDNILYREICAWEDPCLGLCAHRVCPRRLMNLIKASPHFNWKSDIFFAFMEVETCLRSPCEACGTSYHCRKFYRNLFLNNITLRHSSKHHCSSAHTPL